MLWWPFSDARVALDWVAIVDPIYTITLAIGLALAVRRRRRRPAVLGLALSSAYLLFGSIQHGRAVAAAVALARTRGDVPERVRALPPTPTNFVWRTLYDAGGRIHIDAARTPWLGPTRTREGNSIALATEHELSAAARDDARTLAAFRTFVWFADAWVARAPDDASVFVDLRYAVDITVTDALWGIRLHPGAERPVERVGFRAAPGDAAGAQWRAMFGE
jgi:inner membrane protein